VLAYLAASSVMKKKGFIMLTPGTSVIKLFSSFLKNGPNKVVFVIGKPFRPS